MNKQFQGQLIDVNTVKRIIGYRSTQSVYNLMARSGLPRPVSIGDGRTKRWIEAEINNWVQAQIESNRQA